MTKCPKCGSEIFHIGGTKYGVRCFHGKKIKKIKSNAISISIKQ